MLERVRTQAEVHQRLFPSYDGKGFTVEAQMYKITMELMAGEYRRHLKVVLDEKA